MKKVLLNSFKVFLSIIISVVVIMPFSNKISANASLTAPFVGYNVNISARDNEIDRVYNLNCSSSSTTGTFDTASDGTSNDYVVQGPYTVNGQTYYSTGIGNGGIRLTGNINLTNNNSCSLSSSSNIYSYYIYDIEIILDNNYIGYINYTLRDSNNTVLGNSNLYVNNNNVVFTAVNTSLTDLYLTINSFELYLNNNINWVFPFESYPSIKNLYNLGFEQIGINNNNNSLFPIFKMKTGLNFVNNNISSNDDFIVILWSDRSIYNVTNFSNNFSYNSNFSLTNNPLTSNTSGYLRQLIFHNNSSSSQRLNLQCLNNAGEFTVIYANPVRDSYAISNDFALQYGLTNDFINNLNIIANGTQLSNSSSSSLDNQNIQANSTINQYDQIEDNFNDDLNTNLNAITPNSNGLSAMGSKFQTSASWVVTQFNRMTSSTPFGSVLGFSLVLGLGLLIIGKVMK